MMPPPMIIPTKEDLRAMNELLNNQVVQISSTQAPISFSTAFPEQLLHPPPKPPPNSSYLLLKGLR